jgi:hypothetical protein
LTIDNLLSAELVLANGSIVRASETENKDLFWAIRGAGSAFAVATEFVLQAYDQPNPVWAGILGFTPDKLESVIKFANKHHEIGGENEAMILAYARPPPLFQPAVLVIPFYNGPEDQAKRYFADLFALSPVFDQTRMMPYEELNANFNPIATFGDRKSTGASAIKCPLDVNLAQDVFGKFDEFVDEHEGSAASTIFFAFVPYKKIRTVPYVSPLTIGKKCCSSL